MQSMIKISLSRGEVLLVVFASMICSSAFLHGPRGMVRSSRGKGVPRCALDQDSTPLVDALAQAAKSVRSPLFYPGHKMGSGAPQRYVDAILGGRLDALRHDLPELPELDNLFAPEGAIRDAELLAAEAFGATRTWFLANGSTCGIIASILACVQRHSSRTSSERRARAAGSVAGPGSSTSRAIVILPRDAHKSAVHGLVLSGATPSFLSPRRHDGSGLSLGISEADLREELARHGDEVAAVLLVSPSYEGVCTDVVSAARVCRSASVPLIVDEAHGAHLDFLETHGGRETFPRGALRSGADLVVQSAHKTLGSLTQSAFLHLGQGMLTSSEADGGCSFLAERAVADALASVQSSSPNYLLLSSLDAARWSLSGAEKKGRQLLEDAVMVASEVRQELEAMNGVRVLELCKEDADASGVAGMDPLRLTLSFEGGLTGFEADDILTEDFGVYCELSSPASITFVFGPGSTMEHGEILTDAVRHVAREAVSRRASARDDHGRAKLAVADLEAVAGASKQLCTPREAFFASSRMLSAQEAIGLASADTVCLYPPGIPVLLPGEAITEEALTVLRAVKQGGGMISGCTDPTLATIRVVDRVVPTRTA